MYGAPVPEWAKAALWTVGVTAVLLLLFPVGSPNYDTIYSLVWGDQIASFESPDKSAPLAPTPHPLQELFGALVSPLGDGASTAIMVVAYASLGLIGYLVFRLGSSWFTPAIGIVAALIVLTRAPYLSNGVRAYVDLPYIAICLGALLVETRRPRAGWPVLALLAAAGLLRPEAWLFSFAYLAYLMFNWDRAGAGLREKLRFREEMRSKLPTLGALALAAPVGWALFDWATTGSPTYSFTGTRETVETLERETGPVDLVLYGPRRLGEVLQWPGIVGALAGVVLCLWLLRRRAVTGVAATVLALGAFAVLACAGLAIIPRYTMLAAAILAIFAAAAMLGWQLLEPGDRRRRPWQAVAVVVALMFVVWGPNQYDLLSRFEEDLTSQNKIEDDLEALADAGVFAQPLCGPIGVPNHRAVPRLALWLDIEPSEVASYSQEGTRERGYFVKPASEFVVENFILDPNDPTEIDAPVPPGFRPAAENDSWLVYRRC